MRFRQFQNIWIKKSLHDITKKINIKNKNKECKNVICNSAQLGLIRQIDFFDKEIAQDGSIENYTIIKKNDFVYNPRKSLNAPYGPVNIYNYEEAGIVSPLYLCFSVHDIDKIFLHYYFKSQAWYRFIYLNGDSGARHDRVSIKDEVFFSQNLYLPNAIEQEKIGVFLTLIDQRIDTQSKIIEDLELFKNMISYKILYADKTACYKPLSTFSELKNGYAFKSTTYSSKGDYQIVTIANVSGDRYIDLTSSNKIINIPNDIQSHQILKINDILISLTGNVGRVSYCNKLNCLLNQRVGLLSIKNKDLMG